MRNYDTERQHSKGKLHAIERIEALLDEGSFREVGTGITNIDTQLGLKGGTLPYDGVITGYGTIDGKRVCVYSQDFIVAGGTLGHNHGQKIASIINKAVEYRCPVIGINDSGGARIQEGVASLASYGDIFFANTAASGCVPQISIIAGPCAGGAVYSPGITDFIFMVNDIGNMFVTGPKVIKQVTNEVVTTEDLGGAKVHGSVSGVSHFTCPTEQDCFERVRRLLSYIPHSAGEKPEKLPEYVDQEALNVNFLVPKDPNRAYDVKAVIDAIFDEGTFFEVQEDFAKNIVVGFAKLSGISVGIIANQPTFKAGVLDCDSSDKAARFIRFCDCYDIPVVTLTDVPGFFPGSDQEKKGIIRHGAKLLYAYSEATTRKLTVIMRKAYGGAYIAMCSRHLGADYVYAWPTAQMAVMGGEGAIDILYGKQMKNMEAEEKATFVSEKLKEYNELYMNAEIGLANGYVDDILKPSETRRRLFDDLVMLAGKIDTVASYRKHGNIPL